MAAPTDSDSCPICLEDFTKRKYSVVCQFCPAVACIGCQQDCLLNTYEDPHCYKCKRAWSTEFMAATFTATFRGNTLRKHRRKILFEREKALLPAIQVFVGYKREMKRLKDEYAERADRIGWPNSSWASRTIRLEGTNSNTLHARWTKLDMEYCKLLGDIGAAFRNIIRVKEEWAFEKDPALKGSKYEVLREARRVREEMKARRDAMKEMWTTLGAEYRQETGILRELSLHINTLQRQYDGTDGTAPAQRREFIMKCPAEECRGFLSTAYKCGTCEKYTCSECLVIKEGEGHTCNPDTVESAKTIRAETQPCPKCGTRIFKIDGCDQMWCVMEGCNTAFSWRTGHIVTGVIHNPHYYDMLRKNGGVMPREHGDIPCGGMPTTWQFVGAIHNSGIDQALQERILESFRNLQELIDMRLRDYPARPAQLANKDADVEYLMNVITEEIWQKKLVDSESRFARKKEIGQILQTLSMAASDAMNRIFDRVREEEDDALLNSWILDVAIPDLQRLREFGNQALKDLGKRDQMAVPQFLENWAWDRSRILYRAKKAAAAAPAPAPA